MCVPVCSLDPYNPQVGLTLNLGRGGYEIPGGHRDPLEDGSLEPPRQAAVRELTEETGLRTEPKLLIPYGYTEVRNSPDSPYPPRSYMQFFTAYTPDRPGRITDPEVDGAGIFTLDALRTMTERGTMRTSELKIVCMGICAVLKNRGLSDEHIALP
ncbi:MAG TPA: NUDIX hydrolase [Candidatus Saccharimonadales bacterium]|nr:NUDIX hydrolase [Candidatus Saccharimonadales bacterium]